MLPAKLLEPTVGEVNMLFTVMLRTNAGATLKENPMPLPTATSPIAQEIAVDVTWVHWALEAVTRLTGLEKLTSQTAAL